MSFKFNFTFNDNAESEDTEEKYSKDVNDKKKSSASSEVVSKTAIAKIHDPHDLKLEWTKANDVLYTVETIDINQSYKMYFIQPHLNPIKIFTKKHQDCKVTEEEGNDDDTQDNDLIPGVYEGGLKVWECSVDLANFLLTQMKITNKHVLELGCGIGIPGICAANLGAESVTFQDFNDFVITNATAPSVLLQQAIQEKSDITENEVLTEINVNDLLFDDKTFITSNKYTFISGDWENMKGLINKKFDVILTAETIYCIEYFDRLHEILQYALDAKGTIYLAAKSFYFGVGGGVHLWEEFVKSKGIFSVDFVENVDAPLQRHILQMTFKN